MNAQHLHLNIPLNFNQLLSIVRQLSTREKLQLESAIWDETAHEEIEISVEHKKIASQRLQQMELHPESNLTWKDIEQNIKL